MIIKAIAIDDEMLALKKIIRYSEKIGYLDLKMTFTNAHDSLLYLKENSIDLVFLDIQMDGFSGIEFLESIKERPRVVLTTAYESYAIKGYDLGVSDYLLKPISFNRFLLAVERVYKEVNRDTIISREPTDINRSSEQSDRYVFIKSGKKENKVYLDDILYIEGLKDYLIIVTEKSRIVTLHSFMSILELLNSDNFLRVHKSFVIALDKIVFFEDNHVKIGDQKIPVGATYRKLFQKHIRK